MRKIILILMAILLALTACSPASSTGPEQTQNQQNNNEVTETADDDIVNDEDTEADDAADSEEDIEENESGEIEVDKNLLTVEVTYPASLVGDDKDELLNSKEEGIKDIKENEDGSITFTMTKAKYNEMMEEAKAQTIEFLDSMPTSGDFQSIKNVEYNNDFTEIILEVDKEVYENSFDSFASMSIAFTVGFYKVFETGDDFTINIKVKDSSTGDIFSETTFPDDFNDIQD